MNPGLFTVSLFQCLPNDGQPSPSPLWDADYARSVLGTQVSQRLSVDHTARAGMCRVWLNVLGSVTTVITAMVIASDLIAVPT